MNQESDSPSLLTFIISTVLGLIASLIALVNLYIYYKTGEIVWSGRGLSVEGTKALITTIAFLVFGFGFVFFGILEYKRLTKIYNMKIFFTIILACIILGFTIYFKS